MKENWMPEETPLAELTDVQLKALDAMEKELGVTLVAYENTNDGKTNIFEG
ncbi:hypothetical protein NCCP2222_11610 [Sporosarcina sp. NCCP-2222]|uniref:hypothetical protein n=1 Tax=Sporosarcina sp. NCCP-2222 TaxID=2935073 RepID=UPI00208677D0|nr:hypothetical protein [Sporosarcina sp. NCCP-2222]GKV55214.1 hypothetical protein NCCP2222_11610 [Sporosarcina sp. NCCP-2222]